jgi:hypothetical protein
VESGRRDLGVGEGGHGCSVCEWSVASGQWSEQAHTCFYKGRVRPVCARAMGVVVDGSGGVGRIWGENFLVRGRARVPDCARTG